MEPNKVGRPPWIPNQEDLNKVESLAAHGLTQEQIVDCLGIGVSTFCDKKNEYPELLEALKRGKAKGIAKVTAALLDNVDNGNVTAQIFYLKCQAGWREARHESAEVVQSLMEKIIDKL